MLTTFVMVRSSSGRHCLKMSTGSGSSGHEVIEADLIASRTSSSVTMSNSAKEVVHVSLI